MRERRGRAIIPNNKRLPAQSGHSPYNATTAVQPVIPVFRCIRKIQLAAN